MLGHNSKEQLQSLIERVERIEAEEQNIREDKKEIFSQAKGEGFDVKIMKQIIRIRKKDASDLEEEEYLLDTYKTALGMKAEKELEPMPLFQRTNEGMAVSAQTDIEDQIYQRN